MEQSDGSSDSLLSASTWVDGSGDGLFRGCVQRRAMVTRLQRVKNGQVGVSGDLPPESVLG